MLSPTPGKDHTYSGILANTNTDEEKIKSIWIWGLKGLKYFKIDDNTIFSNYSICSDRKWELSNAEVNKNYNVGNSGWTKGVKLGDYVGVYLLSGNTAEIYSYDWWVFINELPFNYFQKTCKNR